MIPDNLTTEGSYLTVVIVYLILLTVIRSYYKIRYNGLINKDIVKYEPLGMIIIRLVFGVLLVIVTVLMIFGRNSLPFSHLEINHYLRILGFPVSAIALLILIFAHNSLRNNFSTTIKIKLNHKLVVTGPYKYIRHPMYVAYLLFFCGLFLLSANWLFGASSLSIILSLMIIRLPYEEANLLEKFPVQYSEYRKTTPKFLPKIASKE